MSATSLPQQTPPALLRLIIAIAATSLLTALTHNLFSSFFHWTSLYERLTLSWQGISHFYIWQIISFLFIQEGSNGGISFSYLLALCFNLYILWLLGTHLCEIYGARAFLLFYFICGIGAGFLTLFFLRLLGWDAFLEGPLPAIIAVIVAWHMIYPEADIFLFFLFPLKAKWLAVSLLTAILLIDISQSQFSAFLLHFFGALCGYLYSLYIWDLRSAFPHMQTVDRFLLSVKRIKNKFFLKKRKSSSSKIFDIRTGSPLSLSDEEFMDAMLTKISTYGEDALTWQEKERMRHISEKKQKERR